MMLLVTPVLACSPKSAPELRTGPTTVLLVRHGEKATDDPRDPSLSPAGQARAQALASLLADTPVTHCFASEFRRTQATLAPLCGARGREITRVPAAERETLVAAIRAVPAGSVVAVAGHSNTVPALVAALGGRASGTVESPDGAVLPDDSYDRLFVVHMLAEPGAPASTLELRYGAR